MTRDLAIDRSFVTENEEQRARMRALFESWSDAELTRPVSAGWTVSAVLAHIGFWDARALYLLDRWQAGSSPSSAECEPEDLDWANDAVKPLCLALPPRTAAGLALRLAEDVDERIAGLTDELLAQNLAAGSPLNVRRSVHRKVHLDEILEMRSEWGGSRVADADA